MSRSKSVASISVSLLLAGFAAEAMAAIVCTGNCNLGPPNVSAGSFGGGNGSLSITAGDVVSTGGYAAFGLGGFQTPYGTDTGSVSVTGTGSRLSAGGTSNSQLWVGANRGTGFMTVGSGGRVSISAFDNAPNFGDARLYVGSGGVGTVNIQSGGTLIVQDPGRFGAEDGIQLGLSSAAGAGTGTINVDGGGSLVVRGNLAFINVGQANTAFSGTAAGTGFLNVTNGGTVLIDGLSGTGFLGIGRGGNSTGNVLVSGAGSRIDLTGQTANVVVANDLTNGVGNTGVGTLRVSNGAVVATSAVTPGTSMTVGFGLGSGLVVVDTGGRLDFDGTIRVSRNSATNSSQTGVLLVNDTGTVKATTTFVGNGTSRTINGVLGGTGTLISNVVIQQGGLLDPGLSPGRLNINGDVGFTGGSLRIEFAGTSPNQADFLNIAGILDLADSLIEFAFIDGYVPTAGDILDFAAASSIRGLDKASFTYTGLAQGFLFNVQSAASSLRFTALNNGAPVSEPGTLLLLCLAMAALLGLHARASGCRPVARRVGAQASGQRA